MTQKVGCTRCGAMILPSTAERNDGLCAPCSRTPPTLSAAQKAFAERVGSGAEFRPSAAELAGSVSPEALQGRAHAWRLEPSYYESRPFASVIAAIDAARGEGHGHVFLWADPSFRLNLTFSQTLAVLAYTDEQGEERYARTNANLARQVPADQHLVVPCPCCGVGMFWYPSRFHMAREAAFSILTATTDALGDTPPHTWIPYGDITFVEPGHG